jgi:HD-like signal output (HDOD) protein
MKLQLTHQELNRLLPSEPGLAAHCHRVAALSSEIARYLPFNLRSGVVLEQASLLHHLRLRRRSGDLPEAVETALRAFHQIGRRSREKTARQVAEVIAVSNLLDEQLEMLALIPQPISEVWAGLRELEGMIDGAVLGAAAKALSPCCRPVESWAADDLPVNSAAARDIFVTLSRKPDCDVPFLARLAGKDPVIAGSLIQAANSALFARRTPVRSIPQALAYVGTEFARKALLALALKPLFASARLAGLWKHSVMMAEFCAGLAPSSGILPSDEALLLGLVHDVGRIAVQQTRGSAAVAYARLLEKGCPPAYIERLLFGCDHAQIGGLILAEWNLPPGTIQAIAYHHRPADTESAAAAFLYLAEFWLDPDEDLSSARHFQAACRRTGFSMETLGKAGKIDFGLSAVLGAGAA